MRATTALVFLFAFASAALAQSTQRDITRDPTPPVLIPAGDGFQLVPPPDGMTTEDLLTTWKEATEIRFTYSDVHFRGKPRIKLNGLVPIAKGDLDTFFEGILVSHGYALVPVGPTASNTFSVEPIESSRYLKSRATFIDGARVAECARFPARVFMTSIQLKEVEVGRARMAVQQILTNRQAEFVQEVQSSNCIVVTGFGPTVAAVAQLVKSLDQPVPEKIQKEREKQLPHRPGGR